MYVSFAFWLFMLFNILIIVWAQFICPNDTVPTCFHIYVNIVIICYAELRRITNSDSLDHITGSRKDATLISISRITVHINKQRAHFLYV